MNCEKCGQEVQIGEWPWCPHGFGNNLEEPLEPYWDEHISAEGAEIRTRGERRRLMARNNLEYKDVSSKRRGRLFIDLGR